MLRDRETVILLLIDGICGILENSSKIKLSTLFNVNSHRYALFML